MNKLFAAILSIPEGERTWQSVIGWWELRRIVFNICVGLAGLLSLFAIVAVAPNGLQPPGITTPGAVWGMVGGYAIAANICYTAGWIAELLARKFWQDKARYFGLILFSLGIPLSVFITLIPFDIVVCFSLFVRLIRF